MEEQGLRLGPVGPQGGYTGGKLGLGVGGILLLGTPANTKSLFFQHDQRSLNGLQVKTD
jgi:hypothetical protein